MIGRWFCGPAPARPPPLAEVRESATLQHGSLVSIGGIQISIAPDPVVKDPADPDSPPPKDPSAPHVVKRRGMGVLIHPTLVLTTHTTVPDARSIKNAEITICRDLASMTYIKRKFVPQIFFETNVELDLTVVSCEIICPEVKTLALDTSKIRRRALRREHTIFIMGCQMRRPEDVSILDGRIVGFTGIKDDHHHHMLRFLAGDEDWMPGSVGFNEFGSFSFIVTRPPISKPATRPAAVEHPPRDDIAASVQPNLSPVSAPTFAPKPKQWGTCIQAIREWLEPLWKRSRDEIFHDSNVLPSLAPPLPTTPGISSANAELNPSQVYSPQVQKATSTPRLDGDVLICEQQQKPFTTHELSNSSIEPVSTNVMPMNNNMPNVSNLESVDDPSNHHHHHTHHPKHRRIVLIQDGNHPNSSTTHPDQIVSDNNGHHVDSSPWYHECSNETPHHARSTESTNDQDLSEDSGGSSAEPLVPVYIECPRAVEHELHHTQFINTKSNNALKKQEKGLELGLANGDVNKAAPTVARSMKKMVKKKIPYDGIERPADGMILTHRLSSVSVQTDEELMLAAIAKVKLRHQQGPGVGDQESILVEVRPMRNSSSSSCCSDHVKETNQEWGRDSRVAELGHEAVALSLQPHPGHGRRRERERWSLPPDGDEEEMIRGQFKKHAGGDFLQAGATTRSRPVGMLQHGCNGKVKALAASTKSPSLSHPKARGRGRSRSRSGSQARGWSSSSSSSSSMSCNMNGKGGGGWLDTTTYYNDEARPRAPTPRSKQGSYVSTPRPGPASRPPPSTALIADQTRDEYCDSSEINDGDYMRGHGVQLMPATYKKGGDDDDDGGGDDDCQPRPRPSAQRATSLPRSPMPPPHPYRRSPSRGANSISGSVTKFNNINAQGAYSKPTISYMQKRNLLQRDSILARRASQIVMPRWM